MGPIGETGDRKFPYEFPFKILTGVSLKKSTRSILPKQPHDAGAAHKDLPMVVPGWGDSTLGNIYAVRCLTGHISDIHMVRSGIEYMMASRLNGIAANRRDVDRISLNRWRQ